MFDYFRDICEICARMKYIFRFISNFTISAIVTAGYYQSATEIFV